MTNFIADLAGQLLGAAVVGVAVLAVLGLPIALWEWLFGPIGAGRHRSGVYGADRTAQELYERRLRDGHRR